MIEKGETKLFSFSMADYKCPEKGPNLRIARAKWEDNIDVTSEEKLQRFLEMRDDGYYGYYPVSNRPYCNGCPLNMRSIGFINTENVHPDKDTPAFPRFRYRHRSPALYLHREPNTAARFLPSVPMPYARCFPLSAFHP